MTLVLLWLQLIAAAAIILLPANFMAKSADIIAIKTGLGRTFVGVVLLATATSLPELVTGLSSVTFIGEPDLAAGDAFGSNLFNMGFILFVDDLAFANGSFWAAISPVHTLTAILAILMTSIVIISLAAQWRRRPGRYWRFEAALLIIVYIAASAMVFTLG